MTEQKLYAKTVYSTHGNGAGQETVWLFFVYREKYLMANEKEGDGYERRYDSDNEGNGEDSQY